MNFNSQLKEGIITQNPVLIQNIGLCSTMAITTDLFNGIGMGISVLIILTCSNIVISLLRKVIPNEIRIAAFVVIIAGFVTMVALLIQAFLPDLSSSLGVFIPRIVVNCMIFARAEAFSYKNGVLASTVDGICQGIGYTLVLVAMSVIREFLGSGSFGGGVLNGGAGIQIFPADYGALLMILPFGGFITLACLFALVQWALKRAENKKKEAK